MKALFLLLFVTQSALAQQFVREFIRQGRNDTSYKNFFGQSCFSSLKKFYAQGGILESQLLKNDSYRLSELATFDDSLEKNRLGVTKTPAGIHTFYHYTNAANLAEVFQPQESDRDFFQTKDQGKSFQEIMTYVKDPAHGPFFNAQFLSVSSGFFYLSSYVEGSSTFGNIQLSFSFSPEARVINMDRARYDWAKLEKEINDKYPSVGKSCSIDRIGILAIEDSGIDLIKYSPIWYQLTNFRKTLNSDVIVFPGHSYLNATIETAERVSNRTYSTDKLIFSQDLSSSLWPEDPSIEIISASWLGKDDSLESAKKLCDDKLTCSFKVHEDNISVGTYRRRSRKGFHVDWRCTSQGEVKSISLPANARNKTVELECL